MAIQIVEPQSAGDLKISQYESTIIDFVKKDQGCFIVVSDDQAFTGALRSVLQKQLALAWSNVLTVVSDHSQILKELKNAIDSKQAPLVFMERILDGQDMTFMVKQLKTAFPKLLIIILTIDVEKHRIMYLHEMGADNFIAKPVSIQTIIEKLAFTIKPQTQLGLLIDSAKEYLENGRPERAKLTALQVLEMKPGSAAGLMALGDAELALGNAQAAKTAYQDARDSAALYMEPLRKLALLAEKTGDMEECLQYLEQLDAMSPLNSDRKVNMGEINLNLGNETKASALFEAALNQSTKDAMDRIGALVERVAAIYADKDPERAEQFLRKALSLKHKQLSVDDIRLFNQLGISLRQQGKWREAVEEYERALAITPDDAGLYFNIGMAYAEGDVAYDARKNMEKALKINPDLPRVSAAVAYNMGLVFIKGAARDKAKMCLEIALELKPNMKQAKEALAKL